LPKQPPRLNEAVSVKVVVALVMRQLRPGGPSEGAAFLG